MKRISVTGYVPKYEKETSTLHETGLRPHLIREDLQKAVYSTKKAFKEDYPDTEAKRVRIVVTLDVETLEK